MISPDDSRQAGRKNDQPRITSPLVMRGLVPATLKFLRIDSLYICTGKAVRYNCRTARERRLRVWPGNCLNGTGACKRIGNAARRIYISSITPTYLTSMRTVYNFYIHFSDFTEYLFNLRTGHPVPRCVLMLGTDTHMQGIGGQFFYHL